MQLHIHKQPTRGQNGAVSFQILYGLELTPAERMMFTSYGAPELLALLEPAETLEMVQRVQGITRTFPSIDQAKTSLESFKRAIDATKQRWDDAEAFQGNEVYSPAPAPGV